MLARDARELRRRTFPREKSRAIVHQRDSSPRFFISLLYLSRVFEDVSAPPLSDEATRQGTATASVSAVSPGFPPFFFFFFFFLFSPSALDHGRTAYYFVLRARYVLFRFYSRRRFSAMRPRGEKNTRPEHVENDLVECCSLSFSLSLSLSSLLAVSCVICPSPSPISHVRVTCCAGLIFFSSPRMAEVQRDKWPSNRFPSGNSIALSEPREPPARGAPIRD